MLVVRAPPWFKAAGEEVKEDSRSNHGGVMVYTRGVPSCTPGGPKKCTGIFEGGAEGWSPMNALESPAGCLMFKESVAILY